VRKGDFMAGRLPESGYWIMTADPSADKSPPGGTLSHAAASPTR
jgi:hypothetical protein